MNFSLKQVTGKKDNEASVFPDAFPAPDAQLCQRALLGFGHAAVDFINIEEEIEEFYKIYQRMPAIENTYGMKSIHLFLMWISLKQLAPSVVIESGVYKGLGTWWIEQAVPGAEIFCIDVCLGNIEYRSPRAVYLDTDFSKHKWENVDRINTVIFFDDHQNALTRLMQMKWMGFKKAIFEDNYPARHGDCYSCKKILSQSGLNVGETVAPNDVDMFFFKNNVNVYQEFPPVFQVENTRWGDLWTAPFFNTPAPLLNLPKTAAQHKLLSEAMAYTWMCFVELN